MQKKKKTTRKKIIKPNTMKLCRPNQTHPQTPRLLPLKARVGERMLGSMFGGLSPSFSASPRGGLPGLPLKQ